MKKTKMKKNKTKTAQEVREETKDLVIANKMSDSVHGGLSRIRLSLTFRIALHFCILPVTDGQFFHDRKIAV